MENRDRARLHKRMVNVAQAQGIGGTNVGGVKSMKHVCSERAWVKLNQAKKCLLHDDPMAAGKGSVC